MEARGKKIDISACCMIADRMQQILEEIDWFSVFSNSRVKTVEVNLLWVPTITPVHCYEIEMHLMNPYE